MDIAGNTQAPVHALAAEFDSARSLFHAAEKIRDAGFRHWDVFSPFPIHGMDQAMGLKRSYLSKIVFFGGLTGTTLATMVTFGPSSFIYPLIVMGKPTNLFTIPAFFPIMFELTILLSAFTATFGMLIINGLPRWNHPLFNWDRFKKVSEDGFFMAIEARDPAFSEKRTRELLESLGATNLTLVHED
ncbi:MAG: DUF3341 domain-containing protein [Chthoniobacterales bacterium]